ncbi:MAG: hypothetical protein K2X29_02425 [Candidatus Obscuribacterales bacterium]|nr:hypothetical protein [Candidatus Obscuribacterales bacterium]
MEIGQKVKARWDEDGLYYKATIVKLKGSRVKVEWEDGGETAWVLSTEVQPRKPKPTTATPAKSAGTKLPWPTRTNPAKGGLVLFRHPKTNQEMFGIAVGGGQTLKVWEPSVGGRYIHWLIPWSSVLANYAYVFPYGDARRGIDLTDNACAYFEEKFKNGKYKSNVPDDINEWAVKRLKVGMIVRVEHRGSHGGLSSSSGWKITAIHGTKVDIQRLVLDKHYNGKKELRPNEKQTLNAKDLITD